MLGERIADVSAPASILVNTGWIGGGYGKVYRRIELATRRRPGQSAALRTAPIEGPKEFVHDDILTSTFPTTCPRRTRASWCRASTGRAPRATTRRGAQLGRDVREGGTSRSKASHLPESVEGRRSARSGCTPAPVIAAAAVGLRHWRVPDQNHHKGDRRNWRWFHRTDDSGYNTPDISLLSPDRAA